MTKTGIISAVFMLVCFVVLYVRQKMGMEGSAMVTLGLWVAYLANITLYIVDAIKGRKSWLTTIFWIYALCLFYAAAIFFNYGWFDSFELISEILSAIILLISIVLVWHWKRNADKLKYSRMFWDFVPVCVGVIWLISVY